jgi:uncharacterized RDD family membrane protein YckC
MPQEFNPYTSNRIDLLVPANSDELEMAERGARLAAVILDSLAMGGILLLCGLPAIFMGSISDSMNGNGDFAGFGLLIIFFLIGLVVWGLYNFKLMNEFGQTWGKRRMGIKVVRVDGTKLTVGRWILLRIGALMALGFIPFAGSLVGIVDTLMIFRADKRCLHDLIADSIVIKA